MSTKDKIILWILGIFTIGLFINMISSILLPFVVSLIAAYFLDPAADKLERMGASRNVATSVITGSFFLIAISLSLMILPLLYDQLISFINKMPKYIDVVNKEIIPSFSSVLERIDPDAVEKAKDSVSEASGYIFSFMTKLVGNVWNSGVAVVNIMSLIFVTPIVTFYMLRDWDKMVKKVDGWVPKKYQDTVHKIVSQIDTTLSGYIRGQTNVCLLLGTFYAVCLSLVGLDFGFFIGFATGILSFIPYVGLLMGFVVGMAVAFFQFGDIASIGMVAAVFIVGQLIEGNFVTPKLVGDKVGLHPVWIIFGMLAGAAMFGFVGILLAVPITAIVGVLSRYIIEKYLESGVYNSKVSKKK